MHKGKKHLKEVAKEYLEPNSEGDHKPAKSDVVKADLINATNKALNQKTRNRKAVKNLNKVLSDIKGIPRKSALNMLGVSNPLNNVTLPKTVDPKTEKTKPTPPSKHPDEFSHYS